MTLPVDDSTATRLDVLERRLAELEAEREIRHLMHDYIEACDHVRDAQVIGSCFTEDATWEGGNRYADWGTTTGRDAIVEMFAGTPDVLPFTAHWLCNERVEVTGRCEARGRWEVFQAATFASSATAVWVGARYDNQFRLTEHGWRIHHLVYSDVFVTPFDQGWARTEYTSPFEPLPTDTRSSR